MVDVPNEELAKVIDDRCRIALAAILSYKDREIDPRVPDAVSVELRRTVLREVNGLAEFALDVISSVRDDRLVLNALWLEQLSAKLDQVHEAVVSNGAYGAA